MGDRKSEAWACVQLAQTLLSAASDEEKQELDLRAKAKEEKAGPHTHSKSQQYNWNAWRVLGTCSVHLAGVMASGQKRRKTSRQCYSLRFPWRCVLALSVYVGICGYGEVKRQ